MTTTDKVLVFIFSLCVSTLIVSCLQPKKQVIVPITKPKYDNVEIVLPKTVIIDGCEYIQWQDDHQYKYITPNIRSLTEKIDSLRQEVRELRKDLDSRTSEIKKDIRWKN